MSAPPPVPRQRRTIHPGILLVIGVTLVLVLVSVAFAIWRKSLGSDTENRLKAIRAAGQPATARELNAWYAEVPPTENAALVWLEGFGKLDPEYDENASDPWSKISLPMNGQALTAEALDEIKKWLDDNQEALAAFHRAAGMSKSRYPVDLSTGIFGDIMPHLGPLRASTKLLSLEAVHHGSQGRGSAAARSLLTIMAAARSLDNEPTRLSQSVRLGIYGQAQSTFQYLLSQHRFPDSDLLILNEAFKQAENLAPVMCGLIGDRAKMVTSIDSPHEIPIPLDDAESAEAIREMQLSFNSPWVRASGFFQRDLRFYLDSMATNIALARLPFPGRFLVATNSEAKAQEAKRRFYIFAGLNLSTIKGHIGREAEHVARVRLAGAATHVERYRLSNNRGLPASLQECGAETLMDPFDGKPLRYQRDDLSYVIYSVGPNQKDDGGRDAPAEGAGDKKPADIVFRVGPSSSRAE